MNRATTVKTGSTTLATINYRPDSRIANITYGNGVLTTYHYDNRGRTTEIKVVQGQTTLLDLNYSYDPVGNVVGIGTESYSYDYLNRLTTGTGAWGTIKYGYDGVGNRLWLYQSPTNITYTYGSYNRLVSSGATSYTYDNNGNRITSTSGGTATKYNYDFENRLTGVSQGSTNLGNYTYSPLGMRIQKIESGTTTTYVNKGINVVYEKAGTTINDYIFSRSMIIAKLTGSTFYYFHQDMLGSTRLITTGSTTSFSTNYLPFGVQYGASGTDPTYKYTERPEDAATGLYYNAARYYDTSVGQFMTRDPSQGVGSPYLYAGDMPETVTDPSGRQFGSILGAIGAAIGAIASYCIANPSACQSSSTTPPPPPLSPPPSTQTDSHCYYGWTGLGCNTLYVGIIALSPTEWSAAAAGEGSSVAALCVAVALVTPPLSPISGGICAAAGFGAGFTVDEIGNLFHASNGYLYVYVLGILKVGCSFFGGCSPGQPAYFEMGVWTDQIATDLSGLSFRPLGAPYYIPLYSGLPSPVATGFPGGIPRTSPWPPGF